MLLKYIFLFISLFVAVFASEIQNYKFNDIKEDDTKSAIKNWLDGSFGVKPYKVNYILPYAAREGDYKSYVLSDEYKSVEAELQVSLMLNVGNNLFGLDESYYVSYTHQAFWQLYAESSPFRETTYNPELFVIFPIQDDNSMLHMRSLKVAYAHRSNGQGSTEDDTIPDGCYNPGNRSRSVNYFYTTLRLQHETLITDITAWVPVFSSMDDNPDLMDYTGYSSLKFHYFIDKHMITLMGRINITNGNGAIESTYSYPLRNSGAYLYAKIFSGYTESLIDYDNYITKFSIGFSFSR
jgi:phospholipase A1